MSNKRGRLIKYSGQNHNGPNEGIPVDAQGNPAIVSKKAPVALTENKEFMWMPDGENTPYIFSDKLGFAETASSTSSKYKKRLGDKLDGDDKIARKSLNRDLSGLMNLQNRVNVEKETKSNLNQLGDGGDLALSTGTGMAKGAAMGAALGPIGAGAGAIIGGVGGFFQGRKELKANAEQEANLSMRQDLAEGNQELQAELIRNPIQSSAIYEDGGSLPKYENGSSLPTIGSVPNDFNFAGDFGANPYIGNIESDTNILNDNSNLNNISAGTNIPDNASLLNANKNATLIGAGSEIIGGTIGAIQSNRRAKRYDNLKGKYDLKDFNPNKISLAEERRDIKDRGATAESSARNKARRMGLTQSQYLAAATASDIGIGRNTTSAIEGSKLNERRINLDETQRVRGLNARNRMVNNQTNQRFDLLGEQARASRDQNIQDIFGTIIPGTAKDINAYQRDDRKINATSKRTRYGLDNDYSLKYNR